MNRNKIVICLVWYNIVYVKKVLHDLNMSTSPCVFNNGNHWIVKQLEKLYVIKTY